MRIRVRALFGVASAVAVVGMMLGSVTPAGACSCAWDTPGYPSSQYFYDQADVVVMGTVTEMIWNTDEHGHKDRDAVFAVKRYFKGHGPGEILVDDPANGAQCGIFNDTDAGERMGLYLVQEEERYFTHACMGRDYWSGDGAEAALAAEMEANFGPGTRPSGGSSLEGDFPYVPVTAIAIFGPLAFLVGAAWLWRPSRASG